MKQGILIGCDQEQEWMLPWWWSHYIKYNSYPVVFIDFGMSETAKKWCRKRGTLLKLSCPKKFVCSKADLDPSVIETWESVYGEMVWSSREQWFRKPFAMLQTPFEYTIWTDLDCEITGRLDPLFQKIHAYSGIAIARERVTGSEEDVYNSGVIAYHKKSPILTRWAAQCQYENDRFLGDQDVLSHIIQTENIEITELSDHYNWRLKFGVNVEALIIHWIGKWGKECIRRVALKS